MSRLRLFAAVEMSGEVKADLGTILRECAALFFPVKWVDLSQLHLTLRFLGDQDEAKVPVILDVLRAVGRGHLSFPVELGGLGTFPGPAKPSVLFVPVLSGAQGLESLARDTGSGLRKMGITFDDRDFHAHVTLGRIKTLKGIDMVLDALTTALAAGRWKMNVEQFVLFQSRLTEKGPIYTALEKFFLKP